VLDEADQMLDSGFAPVIEEILASTPDTRQTALFSATMPDWIATLEKKFLKNPVNVAISAAIGGQSTIEQIAYQVPQAQKIAALCTLLHSTAGESSLIFGRTKFGVEKLGKQLSKLGFTVGTLHANKSQRAREEVLKAFRLGQVQTLLATNVAARGLDITGIDQVINYELPESSDLFTHRIGRTGRMGRQGKAITLLVPSYVPKWRRMARNLGQTVALQRLAIDEEAFVTTPLTSPEASGTREHKQNGEQRPVHGRKDFSPGQERGRHAQPEHDSDTPSGMKRRMKERVTSGTAARTPGWQPEGFPLPEDHSSDKARDGRRGAGKQSSFGRTRGKRKADAFTATAPQHRTARRKPRATPAAQVRRTSASKRSASR
jgi:superfamily II DNA/RNA helicase